MLNNKKNIINNQHLVKINVRKFHSERVYEFLLYVYDSLYSILMI